MLKTKDFIEEVLKKNSYTQRSLSVAAAKAKISLELLDLASSIDAESSKELALALLKKLNGAKAVRKELYALSNALISKDVVKRLSLSPAEINIVLSERTWDARSLLLQLELYWWEGKLTTFEFIDKLLKHKGNLSHSQLKDMVALVVGVRGENFDSIVADALNNTISVSKLVSCFCKDQYQLYDLVRDLELKLPDRFNLEVFETLDILSSKVDLHILCATKKSWKKEDFILFTLKAVHNGSFRN